MIISIAGSDPSTLSGIQGDVKTAFKLKTSINTAITSITVQSKSKVFALNHLCQKQVEFQILTLLENNNIGTIKIGMVGDSSEIIANILNKKAKNIPVIIDPIIISSSGKELLEKSALDNFKLLIKKSYLITPNVQEAEILTNTKIKNLEDIKKSAKKIQNLGAKNILITGGDFNLDNKKIFHFLLTNENEEIIISNKRILADKNNKKFNKNTKIRGTGCRLSTSIACFLNQNFNLLQSVKKSNKFVYNSIKNGKLEDNILIMD